MIKNEYLPNIFITTFLNFYSPPCAKQQ